MVLDTRFHIWFIMTLYYKMRQILLQNTTAIFLQNTTEVYYKTDSFITKYDSYYELQRFYYKMRQLLQNAMFITNCDNTYITCRYGCYLAIGIKFIAFDHWIYIQSLLWTWPFVNKCSFHSMFSFHSLRATSYSEYISLEGPKQEIYISQSVVYCVRVLLSKLIRIKVFVFNPYSCIKYLSYRI